MIMCNTERMTEIVSRMEDLYDLSEDEEYFEEDISEAFELGREFGRLQGAEVYWRKPVGDELPEVMEDQDRSESVFILCRNGRIELGVLSRRQADGGDIHTWSMRGRSYLAGDPYIAGWMPITPLAKLGLEE